MRLVYLLPLAAALAGCAATVDVPAVPVTATPADIAFVERAITDTMRDPESARFRDMTGYDLGSGDRVICGQINGRNGFGGYTGFTPFYIRFRDGAVRRVHVDDASGYGLAAIACSGAAEGRVPIAEAELSGAR